MHYLTNEQLQDLKNWIWDYCLEDRDTKEELLSWIKANGLALVQELLVLEQHTFSCIDNKILIDGKVLIRIK